MRKILPFFFLAMVVSWGCHRNSPVTTQAPAPPKRIEPEAVTPPIAVTELETIPAEPASEAKEKPEPGDLPISREESMDDGRAQLLDDSEFLRRWAGVYGPQETFRDRFRRTAGVARH